MSTSCIQNYAKGSSLSASSSSFSSSSKSKKISSRKVGAVDGESAKFASSSSFSKQGGRGSLAARYRNNNTCERRKGLTTTRRKNVNVITRAHNANDATTTTTKTGTGGGHHLTSKEEVLKGQTKRPIKANTGILEDLEGYVASKTKRRNVYVETYGCQMNVNDSEVMMSVLNDNGFTETKDINDANVILINTCAIRDKAEAKIWQRLAYFRSLGKPKKKTEIMN